MSDPYLIVGLGNPGLEYERTRHNVGFWAVDDLHCRLKCSPWKGKFGGQYAKSDDGFVFLLKPQTYMNKSGEPTKQLAHFFKIATDHVIVIHDELDFEPGMVKLKVGGGAGGHNGLRSLISCIGADFVRVRLGIGKPKSSDQGADHVLSAPSKLDMQVLESAAKTSADAALSVVTNGVKLAMNQVNR